MNENEGPQRAWLRDNKVALNYLLTLSSDTADSGAQQVESISAKKHLAVVKVAKESM